MSDFLARLTIVLLVIFTGSAIAGCAPGCASRATIEVAPAVVKITTDNMTCSGAVIDALGYVLTNSDGIENSRQISVSFKTEKESYQAELVWKDKVTDTAIIRLKSQPEVVTTATIGDSETVKEGDDIVALHYSSDASNTVKHSITGFFESAGVRYIQTDAALGSTDIGGPIVNCNGEVVGLVSAGAQPSMTDSTKCAVLIHQVKSKIDTLLTDGALTIDKVEIPSSLITPTSAVITWRTNRSSNAVVHYGKTGQPGIFIIDTTIADQHNMMLWNLDPDTEYQLNISVIDNNDFTARTPGTISFKTLRLSGDSGGQAGNKSVSLIDLAKPSDITDTSVTFTWETGNPVIGKVSYGLTSTYGSEAVEANASSTHSITITDLIPNTTYHFKIAFDDGSMESTDQTFTTSKQICNKIGCRAPDFSLQTITDNTTKLSDFSGKKLIIIFTGTSCGTCMQQVKYFQEIYSAEPQPDYSVLLIAGGESKDKIKASLKLHNVTLPVLLDTDGTVTSKYRPFAFPGTFFIDQSGIIQRIKNGSYGGKAEVLSIISAFLK